ncbi:hypothetical protein CK203_079770 [Vitis vinifera]|uniref:Uncharacterized protein n=1 Tax=Vitis vinifera TaxID=29760 RepID=A0A438ECF8_VITVI|nr:hypothetical protein CK203_079770 [Vitis vinifera]
MNLLKIHNRQPSYFLNSHTAPLSPPRFLSLPCFRPTPSLPPFPSLSLHKYKFPISRVSGTKPSRWTNEEKEEEFEDLAPNSVVYQKTLRLVECSMFAAVAGLAYFLSNSLAIENYFGCFFSLPIVLSSMRWGVAAGRKTMVATTMLLFVLSGPVKASTYLVSIALLLALFICLQSFAWFSWSHHGFFMAVNDSSSSNGFDDLLFLCASCNKAASCLPLGNCQAKHHTSTLDRNNPLDLLNTPKLVGSELGSFDLLVHICSVRAMGAMGYVLISSFLIRENILALITLNVHASITYMFTAIGVNTIPSMDLIYALFGTLTWDEGFTNHAKMAGEGNIILVLNCQMSVQEDPNPFLFSNQISVWYLSDANIFTHYGFEDLHKPPRLDTHHSAKTEVNSSTSNF